MKSSLVNHLTNCQRPTPAAALRAASSLLVPVVVLISALVPTLALGAVKVHRTVEGNHPEAVHQNSDGSMLLKATAAFLYGPSVRINTSTHIAGWWQNQQDRAEWSLPNVKQGSYEVWLTWGVPEADANQPFVVELDGKTVLTGTVPSTGGYQLFHERAFGKITLAAGSHRLTFRPAGSVKNDLLDLYSIALLPAGYERKPSLIPPKLKVPEGFEVELVAGPPLVHHPTMACLDDRGRLFLSESSGANAQTAELVRTKPHSILMLEDTDGDGHFDKRNEFATGLVQPNGAAWYDGSLYVCSIPFLWRFTDTDDDGKADKQEPVLGYFNDNGMSSAFHGPVLGADGRFYWCAGQHGWVLEHYPPGTAPPPLTLKTNQHGHTTLDGKWTSSVPGAFSAWPDGTDARAIGFGGISNPVEVALTEEGEVFGTVAVYEMVNNARRDAVLHWVDGGVFNLRKNHATQVPRTGDALPPLSYRGHSAPSGIMRYRSDSFGPGWRDNFLFTEFNLHKVYRLIVERDGASFRSRDEVFLSSSSSDTHFTDVFEDADGSVLVIDTGGWFLYGCPTSRMAKPQVLGGIYRVRRKDAPRLDDPRGLKLAWDRLSAGELTELLDDPRFVVRDRAIARLAARNTDSLAALQQVLAAGSVLARRNALWTLTRMDLPAARSLVRSALDSPDASVRLVATRSVSTRPDSSAAARLAELAGADDAAVRREAATALGRLGDPQAVSVLLKNVATAGQDRFLEHSLIHALIRIADPQSTRSGLAAAQPRVRRAALIALDQMADSQLSRDEVVAHLGSTDPSLQQTALGILTRRGWADELVDLLREWLAGPKWDEERANLVRTTLLALKNDESIITVIGSTLDRANLAVPRRLLLLEVIEQAGYSSTPTAWIPSLQRSLNSTDPDVLRSTLHALRALGLAQFDDQLRDLARDSHSRYTATVRLAAVRALKNRGAVIDSHVFAFLVDQLNPNRDAWERLQAAKALGETRLNDRLLLRLTRSIKGLGPVELLAVLPAYEQTGNSRVGRALLNALTQAQGLAALSAPQLERLSVRYPEAVRVKARQLGKQLSKKSEARQQRLTQLQTLSSHGDAARGRAAFRKGACHTCHRVNQDGGSVGPDLSHIGRIRSDQDLAEAILFPSASLARGYESFTALLKNGEEHTGRLTRDTSETIHLMTGQNNLIRISRGQLESLRPSSVSIMPDGLDQALNDQELADLVAYLKNLK